MSLSNTVLGRDHLQPLGDRPKGKHVETITKEIVYVDGDAHMIHAARLAGSEFNDRTGVRAKFKRENSAQVKELRERNRNRDKYGAPRKDGNFFRSF